MTVIVRSVRSMLGLLLLAALVAASGGIQSSLTNFRPRRPNRSRRRQLPAESPKRVDPPIAATARPPIAATQPCLEEILRAAETANAEACQIVIGNLVNATTPAYKRRIVSFTTLVPGGAPNAGPGDNAKVIPASFVGVAAAQPLTDLRQGKIRHTGRELDLAIDGEGYFWVPPADDPSGREIHFTRCGRFSVDRNGNLVIHGAKRDWVLTPRVTIPDDAGDIKITNDGVISLLEAGYTTRTQIGNIQLHTFAEDCELVPCGDNVVELKFKRQHGSNWIGNPGMNGNGVLRQGCLEDSNVDPQQEFETLQKLQEQAHVLEQAAQLLRFTQSPDGSRTTPPAK